MTATSAQQPRPTGRLRIGNDWNAINILALSQTNPLKAVAEFVENSIDARAKHITITRGREDGEQYLRVKDDGEGIRKTADGLPDFHYVATHICDSLKRHLKKEGQTGIQGEFGIGLLSFWTVGERLTLSCFGSDGRRYDMSMQRGKPSYEIAARRMTVAQPGTELAIYGILPGLKQLSGERIQLYLASELRDRIRSSGVEIRVIDRNARAEYKVEPRQFEGRLLHELGDGAAKSAVYHELYITDPAPANVVSLFRSGTRVLENIAQLEGLAHEPWNSGYLQGIIDCPALTLSPGSRLGVIQDQAFSQFLSDLAPLEAQLNQIIAEQRRVEEEQASQDVLKSIQKALRNAISQLPPAEYDWFDVRAISSKPSAQDTTPIEGTPISDQEPDQSAPRQRAFFEMAGPLYRVRIQPGSAIVRVGESCNFSARPADKNNRAIQSGVTFTWQIADGAGTLSNEQGEIVTFTAPAEPQLVKLIVTAHSGELSAQAESLITVTTSIVDLPKTSTATTAGIPGYTLERAAGQLWRSRYDSERQLVVINSGHRDYLFASRNKSLKLRYLCRLFLKELVLKSFPSLSREDLLERLLELSLYTEEGL